MNFKNLALTLTLLFVAFYSKAQCPASTNTLNGAFNGNNSFNGVMFDVRASNDIVITCFDINVDAGPHTIEVYTRSGTHVGFEADAAAWSLVGTTNVTSAGNNIPTPLPLAINTSILAGESSAFYITTTGTTMNYTNGTGVGNVLVGDTNIELLEGSGKQYPFAATFRPRVFNGNIFYRPAASIAIDTTNINTTDFCLGNFFLDVPFIFNGTTAPDNVFTVELSDADGNFTPAAFTASGASSPIRILAPRPTNPNATYKVRVASSNPAVISDEFEIVCIPVERPDYTPVLTGEAGYSFANLTWSLPPVGLDIAEYEVYMGLNNEEPTTLLTIAQENTLRIDLINGTNYSFQVRPIYVNFEGNNYEVGNSSNIINLKPSVVLGENEESNSALKLYPNPSNGNFTLQFNDFNTEKGVLKIMNLTGKTILTKELKNINNKSEEQLELVNVNNGIYIIQVQTEKGVYQQKIMIAK